MHCKMKEIFGYFPSPRNFAENSGEFLARLFKGTWEITNYLLIFAVFYISEQSTTHNKTNGTWPLHKINTSTLSSLCEIL